jgi:hypothetical protein
VVVVLLLLSLFALAGVRMLPRALARRSYGHAYGAEVYLAEVPSQLIIRDSWMDAERDNISQVVVKVDPSINLDGPCVASLCWPLMGSWRDPDRLCTYVDT